ncbi:ZAP1 [Candida jiufengensis]|uniref:ZAP1 n=1 Tax=Candida jiufengensis TaxID=497108 RepID=UPI0022247ADF|nr:ZAP1 [Candida jiufengensis]KAI5955353.1 ZAP1 [Candida jiufengensis]
MKLDNNAENITTCKDSFCDELDDCFFMNHNCDDNFHNTNDICDSSCWTICCDDENCIPTLKSQHRNIDTGCCDEHISNKIECCNQPDCDSFEVPEDFEICHDIQCSYSPKNHHKEINRQCETSATTTTSSKRPNSSSSPSQEHIHLSNQNTFPPLKKSKVNNFNEYDIHFPNEGQLQDSTKNYNNNHLQKTCYHPPNNVSQSQDIMSDIDKIMKYNVMSTEFQPTVKIEDDPLQYSCQWEHCFKKLSNDNFINHIMGDHISQEQNVGKSSSFQCEWSNCNYSDLNLDTLLNHLETHKNNTTNSTNSQNINVLTPLSSASGNAHGDSPSELKTNQEYNYSFKNSPTMQEQPTAITQFKCNWQVGTDANGNPIPCHTIHTTEGDLQNHIVTEHIGSGKSTYCCDWIGCDRHKGKIFNQRQKLYRHIHVHTNYKPCKCEICGASFAVESMLIQHLRIHSGEKPFSCKICGKKFATSSSLSIHNRVHTGEKPLKCKWPGCGKSFSESSNLTKHMKIHTKKFECEICGEAFVKKFDYNKHLKMHKGRDDTRDEEDGERNILMTPSIKTEFITT